MLERQSESSGESSGERREGDLVNNFLCLSDSMARTVAAGERSKENVLTGCLEGRPHTARLRTALSGEPSLELEHQHTLAQPLSDTIRRPWLGPWSLPYHYHNNSQH
jgi:hypothetical protein